MSTSNKPEWVELLRRLERDWCPCGSGGLMACDEDCPGDRTNPALVEAVKALLYAQSNEGERNALDKIVAGVGRLFPEEVAETEKDHNDSGRRSRGRPDTGRFLP